MPTIKDIAKIAGVSHGTVSNVLNGRGNVSVKKIKLVEEAALKLDYQLNVQAKILKEGYAKTISIILPNITSEQYNELYEGLFSSLNRQGYELSLYLTHDTKELELKFIHQIATKRDSAIVAVSCLESASSYYQTIKIAQDKIIFVYRQPEEAKQFISLDYQKAGNDIAGLMMQKKYQRIGLLSNSQNNTHVKQFKKGILAQFGQAHYHIDLHHIESTPSDSTYSLAFTFFSAGNKQFDAIITSDMERAHYIRNASYLGSLINCPPIYTLANNNFFYEDNFHQYHMNYGMLSQQIINLIEGETIAPIVNKGFLFLSERLVSEPIPNQQIKFLTLPSPSTEAVRRLLPHFKKMSGIDVNLIVKPFDEIYQQINQLHRYPDIDIIRIDMASLPWFAKSALKPLSALNVPLDELLIHYPKQVVERFTYFDNTPYAIPFDPSIQLLFYRNDLFNDPLTKRLYFETYRQPLTVPENFIQFNQITQFFNRSLNPESLIDYGGCVTLGNSEIVASEFLVRYYAQGGKLIHHSAIKLDMAIAITTLNEFKRYIHLAKTLDSSWWQESVNQFEQGHLAMLIVYMNLFSYMSHKNILPITGYAAVPGNRPLFGGGSLAMSKYSQKNEDVSIFFNWLFSKEISEQIALLGGSTARDNIFQNQQVMSNYPWFNITRENYLNGVRENHFVDGQRINLRQVENIIGQHILRWIADGSHDETMLINLNRALSDSRQYLIG